MGDRATYFVYIYLTSFALHQDIVVCDCVSMSRCLVVSFGVSWCVLPFLVEAPSLHVINNIISSTGAGAGAGSGFLRLKRLWSGLGSGSQSFAAPAAAAASGAAFLFYSPNVIAKCALCIFSLLSSLGSSIAPAVSSLLCISVQLQRFHIASKEGGEGAEN